MVKTKIVSAFLLMAGLAFSLAPTPAQAQLNLGDLNITDIDIDPADVQIVDGVLTAVEGTVSGTIAGLPFTTDIENLEIDLIPETPTSPQCSVLNLELAPIDIDLLGLHVDTSEICLNVTAVRGGGLLGDLLCGLTGDLLGGVTGDLLGQLTGLLEDLLNGALADEDPAPSQGGGTAEDICDGAFEILDLALGPVNLNLLGLVVDLDDCEDGPVQVCVSADQGQGLLGDLLVGLLDGGLLDGLNLGQLGDLLGAILDGLGLDLGDLIDIITGGLDLNLNPPQGQVRRLTNAIGRALANGALSDSELNQIENTAKKIANLPVPAGGLRQ